MIPRPSEPVAVRDLEAVFESLGEVEQALAICLELHSDAGDYRDVAVRIRRLARSPCE